MKESVVYGRMVAVGMFCMRLDLHKLERYFTSTPHGTISELYGCPLLSPSFLFTSAITMLRDFVRFGSTFLLSCGLCSIIHEYTYQIRKPQLPRYLCVWCEQMTPLMILAFSVCSSALNQRLNLTFMPCGYCFRIRFVFVITQFLTDVSLFS